MVQLYPEFYNDTFGPIMQPGSSSHMAAPCRMGYLCNSLLGEELAAIRVELDTEGSFTGTFGLMNEDLGMLNGAAGHLPDYPDFFEIKPRLQAAGIPYEFDFCVMKESSHINAVKFILTGKSGKKASLVANSTGGGMVETVWVNGYGFAGKGDTWVLLAYDPSHSRSHEQLLEAVSAGGTCLEDGIAPAQQGEGCAHWFKLEKEPSAELKATLAPCDCMKPVLPVPTTSAKKPQLFDTMVEWRRLAKEQGKSLVDVAIDYEMAASGWTREEVVAYMRDKVQPAMYRRSHASYEEEGLEWQHTPFDQRHEQAWLDSEQDNMVKGPIFKSIKYMEANFPSFKGVLNVPGPMGGGGGLIYGTLSALQDEYGYTDEQLLNALFISAGVGALCYTRSAPTGEVTGCTGEMGCCSAMAAAGVAYLRGGTDEQIENAATFALMAAIGWPCDPIPGGHGMACHVRGLYMASMSVVCAQYALLGMDPVLPFHEELDVADRIGRSLSGDLLCTSRGGHCWAPSAQKCMKAFRDWHEKQ
ncbi:MAG: L-serine ammonia-lyase, iron-sulfur-dependent, subunit alpha [Clostridia bacterium]|nr:L-serine ammonia-lyase, iron-sulfur-dependent, subunit alpha [Clostridia bacterium]